MKFETKKQLMDKTRDTVGLIDILKCEVDILRKDAAECNLGKIRESITEAAVTIQKLHIIVSEMEHILNVDEINSRDKQIL